MAIPIREEGRCFVCSEIKPVRYIDLYVIGSEGLVICHSCEMKVVRAVTDIMRDAGLERKAAFLAKREV